MILLVAMLLCVAAVVDAVQLGPWPMVGHDAAHTGVSTIDGPHGPDVAAAWTFSAGDHVYCTPVSSADGRLVLVGTASGVVVALNTSTGEQVWQFVTGDGEAFWASGTGQLALKRAMRQRCSFAACKFW